jgi:hypothetical protein
MVPGADQHCGNNHLMELTKCRPEFSRLPANVPVFHIVQWYDSPPCGKGETAKAYAARFGLQALKSDHAQLRSHCAVRDPNL